MNTPEGVVKDRVKRLLKKHGAYYHMPVQNGLGAPSLDFIGCHKGLYFAIETKAGNKQPTPRQYLTMRTIQDAGGQAFLVNEAPDTLHYLEQWLAYVDTARTTSNSTTG